MLKDLVKWFYPGMRVKRWIATILLGVLIVGGGFVAFASTVPVVRFFGIVIIVCGIVLIVLGTLKMMVSFLTVFLPQGERELVDILYQRRYLERGPKIVTIGGGHGLAQLLLGLKEYSANLTAIVTVADSGGSSGKLREEFNIVAPGDIRNCLVALADAPALMGDLFQFRFSKDSQLQGHNFGNLFLTAMVQVTGDFERAVKECGRVLAIRGRVIPSTVSNVNLVARYSDGSLTEGEARIPQRGRKIDQVFLKPAPVATAEALEAIYSAEVVILGPGSLYTSILPNLVIPEIAKAIRETGALKIFVCNVMTQRGETEGYSAGDHVRAIIEHAGEGVLDACLVNTAEIPVNTLGRYKAEDQFPVTADIDKIRDFGCQVEAADLLHVQDYVRHDSTKLTKALIQVIERQKIVRR